ncbi:MAG TPA: response regulator, partial [Labilithrix sp.]|nr:response regulator [Labilithrix sp.]
MRILVVDRNPRDRDVTLCLLPAKLHDIVVAEDAAAALAILDEREFDLVLIESTLTGITGTDLVKRIRARESTTHTYVIMTAARESSGDLKAAFDAGVDDFVRKPLGKDELLARIDAPNRIRHWMSRVLAVGLSPAFAPKTADLSALSAWSSVDASICSEVAEMLGMHLSVATGRDVLDGSVAVATLPLSLANESAEVCFAVGVDAAASTALAEAVFGDPQVDAAAVKDMIGEVVNLAAGAFKRLAA